LSLSLAGIFVLLYASGSPAARPDRANVGRSFSRVDSKTEIKNVQCPPKITQCAKLMIDARGETADYSTIPSEGGVQLKEHYTWKVPTTLVAGKELKKAITISSAISNVQPDQPWSDSINALAPGFAQQLIVQYPSPGKASKTYDYMLPAGQTAPFTIAIGFLSSYVIYHYEAGVAARTHVTIYMRGRSFVPNRAELQDGGTLRLCNRSDTIWKPFSVTRANRFEPGAVARGACIERKLHNPTSGPFEVKIFDELKSTAKLVVLLTP
jgi:hypothetical protein